MEPIRAVHRKARRGRRRAQHAVFVDLSGRRRVVMHRVGVFVVLSALAYLAVLVSALIGGPTVNRPQMPAPPSEPQVLRRPAIGQAVLVPAPSSPIAAVPSIGRPATPAATAPPPSAPGAAAAAPPPPVAAFVSVPELPARTPESPREVHSPAAKSGSPPIAPGSKPTAPPGQDRTHPRPSA